MQDILYRAERYRLNCAFSSRSHHIASERASGWNRLLGIPVIITTTTVGTTIFGTMDSNSAIGWKITAGLISLSAAVLSALQTAFKFSERAEQHKKLF